MIPNLVEENVELKNKIRELNITLKRYEEFILRIHNITGSMKNLEEWDCEFKTRYVPSMGGRDSETTGEDTEVGGVVGEDDCTLLG